MKLYITGPVGSGKSTLARQISQQTGIPCCHLDSICYEPDPEDSWGNRKRPLEEQQRLFQEALNQREYVMEDAGRARFVQGMEQADQVILLLPSPLVRRWRILSRWMKQRLGLEPCLYRPRLEVLRSMFRWSRSFDTGADTLKERLIPFSEKTVLLRTNGECRRYLEALPHKAEKPMDSQ